MNYGYHEIHETEEKTTGFVAGLHFNAPLLGTYVLCKMLQMFLNGLVLRCTGPEAFYSQRKEITTVCCVVCGPLTSCRAKIRILMLLLPPRGRASLRQAAQNQSAPRRKKW